MEPLYPYTVVTATGGPYNFAPAATPEQEILEDSHRIYAGISGALSKDRLATVCRFVRTVIANAPLLVSRKHQLQGIEQSIVIIPTQVGKTVFVSHRKTIPANSGQSFKFKEVSMLSFDHNGRLSQGAQAISTIIKLITNFSAGNTNAEFAKKRISIMQKMRNYSCFPTNYGFVVTDSKKMGTKLTIFQERALYDLFDFEEQVMFTSQLPLSVKYSLGKTIVCALQALHSQQIIYRDLKFENILVFEEIAPLTKQKTWKFKLTDFGLACSTMDIPARIKKVGTIDWVAPEQLCNGTLAEYENDLWSLGLIIHFLFDKHMPQHMRALGVEPFSDWITWREEIAKLPQPPQRLLELQDLIPSLLQADPQNRISLDDVHEFLESKTSSWCNIL